MFANVIVDLPLSVDVLATNSILAVIPINYRISLDEWQLQNIRSVEDTESVRWPDQNSLLFDHFQSHKMHEYRRP